MPPAPASPRAVVAEARRLRAAIETVRRAPDEASLAARRQHDVIRHELVHERLAALPVDALREVTEGRLRLGGVEDAGYRTVASILAASHQQLDGVRGVGPHTASQLLGAARQIESALHRTVRVRFDVDRRTPSQTALLVTLAAFERARRLTDALLPDVEPVARPIDEQLGDAIQATRRIRLLFSSRRRKERARAALASLAELLALPSVQALGHRLRAVLDELQPPHPPVDIWGDYQRRAATYNGLLIEAAELGPDVDASQGFLPADIAARVRDLDLDVSLLNLSLRGYQAFGAKFALVQRAAILGDEMGLGKTIEALAAICHLRRRHEASHFLVVSPAGILASWDREIQRHSELRSHRLHGPDRDDRLAAWKRDGGVAVTSYETLRSLGRPSMPVSMLVVDEAHYVKNPEARRTKTVRQWIAHAERTLLLTGTPMENRVEEFRTLVGHVRPDLADRVSSLDGLAGATAFRQAVAPVYLRRNQDDVLDELPPRIETEEWVELEGGDLDAYRQAVASGNFMAMRRAAYLAAAPSRSAKLVRLQEIVHEAVANDRKVVVFSYFRDVLDRISDALGGLAVGPLTGSVPPQRRDELITGFSANAEPLVLVSQIIVGGVGLNLQAASVVVLAEPQWKPSTEDQAIARCHRMGQAHPVDVHRLLAEDSVDQRMLEVLAAKAVMIDEYVEVSVMKEVTPDAIDVSDLHSTETVVTQAEAERTIVQTERARLGLEAIER